MTARTQPRTALVTLVHSPACHLCEDAEKALVELARLLPARVEMVAADSARGRALMREHRAPMYPLVLVDGQYLSAGRLPRGRLRRLVAARTSAGDR